MSLERIFALARSRSLVPLPFVGAVGSRASAKWLSAGAVSSLGDFVGAGPRQADLLVVIGEISHKAAPTLQRLHARMADPSYVLWVRAHDGGRARALGYATAADVAKLLPVDVVIEGDPPSADGIEEGLELLRERVRTRRGKPK